MLLSMTFLNLVFSDSSGDETVNDKPKHGKFNGSIRKDLKLAGKVG